MTKDKVLEAVERCVERFASAYPDLKAARVDDKLFLETKIRVDMFKAVASHALYMQEQIAVFLEDGRTEKAMRWLGFLQGVMWMTGVPLSHFKEMNRPDEEKN